jgi:hypothetical protein
MSVEIKEPEGKDVLREKGSTTLNQCGWCEYAMGSHRYNYCIEGKCNLQKSYSPYVVWSDKCKLLDASISDINAIIKNHKYQIESCESSIKRYKKYIKVLNTIMSKAPTRPPLPDDRSHDHFKLGDEIALHMDNEWHFGEVMPGYRHHDGCVSYRLENKGPQGKDFWGCGVSVPIVMLKSEYDFFKINERSYEAWCEKAYSKKYNGNTLRHAPITHQHSD